MRTTSGRASGDVPPAPLSGSWPGLADGIRCGHMEAASTTVTTSTAAVAISNLDAAVAQSKAAAALLAAAAAAIRQLPNVNVDVVTDRVNDSAGALAIHASVSADIRDQLSRPVREALAGLAAACHRWVPVQRGAVAVNISGEVNKDTIRAISETVRRAIDSSRLTLELAGHTFGARFAIATLGARLAGLPVALGHEEASALRDYAGALMPGDDEFPPEDALPPSYRGPAINLAGHVIDVFNSADVCSWDGVRIVVTDA